MFDEIDTEEIAAQKSYVLSEDEIIAELEELDDLDGIDDICDSNCLGCEQCEVSMNYEEMF